MPRPRFRPVVGPIALLLACSTGLVWAQSDEQPRPALPAPAVQPAQAGGPSEGAARAGISQPVSLAFAGGTVAEYVKALRDAAAPLPANVAFQGEVASVRVPAIELENVALINAVRVLEYVAETSLQIQSLSHPEVGGAPVFAVRAAPRPAMPQQVARPGQYLLPDGELATHVVAVSDLITPSPRSPGGEPALDLRTLLSAIEAAVAMEPQESERADVRFHRESGLLIMRGKPRHIEHVRDVISTLRADAESRQGSREAARQQATQLRVQIEATMAEVKVSRLKLDVAREQLARLETLVARGVEQPDHVSHAMVNVAEREAALAKAEATLQLLRDQYHALIGDDAEAGAREQLDEFRARNDALRQELTERQRELDTLQQRMRELEERRRRGD